MKKNPKPKITQNDVAHRAGVTRSMVSYVINGSDRSVASETRRKILDAISELEYRPNKFAQALSMGNKGVLADQDIGIVLYNAEMFLRPYYAEILAGIHQAAYEKGFHIRFIRFLGELKAPVLFNQLIHSEEICGLLLVGLDRCMETPEGSRLIERIQTQIDQIVCVDWQIPGLSSVSFDRQAAAFRTVSYLFDQGYSDIAYIGESDQRVTGFKQFFLEHGVEDISGLYIDAAADMASGHKAAQRLHQSRGSLPKAICAGSDEVAVGILLYLHEQGIAVPTETALISIDNIEMAAYANPQLTTMNVQKRAMGYRAVEMIVNRAAGRGENALTLLLPTNLIIRKST
ncbi:MAG: LacI family transcriptional regulator [Treponema sp.]|nr:LacI family transcriptional regulator [Treponema sp.]